jgi:hypothetical protein
MRESPHDVQFDDLYNVCLDFFGLPRYRSGSHCTFRMPWGGNPRVNIQPAKNGLAKPYRVRQALAAIDKLLQLEPKEDA